MEFLTSYVYECVHVGWKVKTNMVDANYVPSRAAAWNRRSAAILDPNIQKQLLIGF